MPAESESQQDLARDLLLKAKEIGASLAGIASVASLRNAPSHKGDREIEWPEEARSVLVLALDHEASEPELDWWDDRKGGTDGNRQLIRIAEELIRWLSEEFSVNAQPLPYYVQNGGIFIKDAGALAGLGTIGKNNLLVTPEYGPRVRLRGLFIELDSSQNYKSPSFVSIQKCLTCYSDWWRHNFINSYK